MRYFIVILVSFFVSVEANEIAVVKQVVGDAFAKSKSATVKLHEGLPLESNVVLITKDNAQVTVIFKDASVLNIGANSFIKLDKFVFKPDANKYNFKLFLKKGGIVFESGRIGDLAPKSFELKTPQGVVAIRGTKFAVKVK